MDHTASALRRYIDLFEATESTKVRAKIESYKDAETADEELPTAFVFDFDAALESEEITQAIRAEIRQATGYEPARLRWKRIVS